MLRLFGAQMPKADLGTHSDNQIPDPSTQPKLNHGGFMPELGDVITSILSQLTKGYQPQRKDIDPVALVQVIGQLAQVFKPLQAVQSQGKSLTWPEMFPPFVQPDIFSSTLAQNKAIDPVAAVQVAAQIANLFKGFQPPPAPSVSTQNKDFWNAVAAAIPVIAAVAL
jgi:hypothetical protein